MPYRHELPTHLGVEDTAIFGLTFRQVLTAAAGLALAYAVADALPLPLAVRAAAGAVVLASGLTVALWRPAGRPLETWAAVLLAYAAGPRVAVWQPGEAEAEGQPEADEPLPVPVVVRLPVRPAGPTPVRPPTGGRPPHPPSRRPAVAAPPDPSRTTTRR